MDATALAQRLSRNTSATLEMYAIYLGDQLGYYRALADGRPVTADELAERAGTAPRYTREWLEHQAAVGVLEVDDPRADARTRRYVLPTEHAAVLADQDSTLFAIPAAVQLARYGRRLPDVVAAYRTGEAPAPLPWGPEGRGESNRAVFMNLLGKEWLPSIVDVDERLRSGARVADIACGTGWSSIAMALAYNGITVDGVDLDEDAIAAARDNAQRHGVGDRVRFSATDAAGLAGDDRYDLVTIIEALHDMTQPVRVLRAARELLSDSGSLLVVDVRVEEGFSAPGTEREQCEYGWSLIACLPDAMGEPGSAATGTVMRPGTLRRYAAEAGFDDVRTLPVDIPNWRIYQLTTGR